MRSPESAAASRPGSRRWHGVRACPRPAVSWSRARSCRGAQQPPGCSLEARGLLPLRVTGQGSPALESHRPESLNKYLTAELERPPLYFAQLGTFYRSTAGVRRGVEPLPAMQEPTPHPGAAAAIPNTGQTGHRAGFPGPAFAQEGLCLSVRVRSPSADASAPGPLT